LLATDRVGIAAGITPTPAARAARATRSVIPDLNRKDPVLIELRELPDNGLVQYHFGAIELQTKAIFKPRSRRWNERSSCFL
jgi:hypothetical protein